eukprot:391209-Pelagomonas_calceolata.AAC.2
MQKQEYQAVDAFSGCEEHFYELASTERERVCVCVSKSPSNFLGLGLLSSFTTVCLNPPVRLHVKR